jgi:hypothetical protein
LAPAGRLVNTRVVAFFTEAALAYSSMLWRRPGTGLILTRSSIPTADIVDMIAP